MYLIVRTLKYKIMFINIILLFTVCFIYKKRGHMSTNNNNNNNSQAQCNVRRLKRKMFQREIRKQRVSS